MNITPEQLQGYVDRFRKVNTNEPLSPASKSVYKSYLKDLINSENLQYFFRPDEFLQRLEKHKKNKMTKTMSISSALKLIDILSPEEMLLHFPNQQLSYAEGKNVISIYKKAAAEGSKSHSEARRAS